MVKNTPNIFKIVKNNMGIVVSLVIWVVVTIFNMKGYWMLVDDGEGVVFSRTLVEKISELNLIGFVALLFETNGRFRPVYWFYQMIVWLIGGNSYQFHHFAHMLVIGAGMLFVYLIVKELTRSKLLSIFASLFFLLAPLNTENIFRLGPQEPLLVVVMGALFFLLIKNKKVFLPSLTIVLAIFTKETSVALFPMVLFYFIYVKKSRVIKNKKQAFYLLVAACFTAICLILITFLRRGGYSTNYSFDFGMILGNLVEYFKELTKNLPFIFPLIPIIYIVRTAVRLISKRSIFETKSDLFEFIFFAGFLAFLGIQLPWKYALVRYMMPAGFFSILFSFIEIYRDIVVVRSYKLIKKYNKVVFVFLTVFSFYVFSLMALDLVLKTTSSVNNYSAFKRMAGYPKDITLLMNLRKAESTVELVYETKLHLSEFWGREDIKVEYLTIDNLPTGKYIIVDTDQFPRAVTRETLDKTFNGKYTYLENNTSRLIITTPVELIKQTIKKSIFFVVYKKPFTSEGIYTHYYGYSSWYFYHEV